MTNGLAESKNVVILQALRAYCKSQQDDWPELLPGIMMAYRSTPATQSTDFSPFFLLYGREMRLPIDTLLQPKDNLSQDYRIHIGKILQNLEICRKLAGENIEAAQQRYKQQYDKYSKTPEYRPAQRVWLFCTKVPVGKAPKLHRKWLGPYYITMLGPNHTYRLRHSKTNKEVKSLVNAMRLKPYYDPDSRPTNVPQELTDDETEYDPDEIVANDQPTRPLPNEQEGTKPMKQKNKRKQGQQNQKNRKQDEAKHPQSKNKRNQGQQNQNNRNQDRAKHPQEENKGQKNQKERNKDRAQNPQRTNKDSEINGQEIQKKKNKNIGRQNYQ